MEVRACKNCRRLFQYISGPDLCPDCRKLVKENLIKEDKEKVLKGLSATIKPLILEDEEKLDNVKDYIITHPKATIVQISEANDIPAAKLFEWIREERLEFSDDSQFAWFECVVCGAKIKSGTLCNRCKSKLK